MAEHDPALVEKAARAAAIYDDYDGCFERVDEWEAAPADIRALYPDEEPVSDREDCEWWRARIRAALDEVVPAIREAAVEEVARKFQFGGWTILTAPPPAGAIPSLALGQRVTDWLRAQLREEQDRG